MNIFKKALIFFAGFLCAWVIFSIGLQKGACQSNLPPNILFSGDSTCLYFLDKDESKIYRYNTQGRLIRAYVIKELGEDFLSK